MDDAAAASHRTEREPHGRRGPRVRGPVERRAERHSDRPADERADALKERVYATFTGLAIVLVQYGNVEHVVASNATYALLIGIVGITIAGFAADVIAHMSVHAAFPTGEELARMLRIAGSALASAIVPLVLLVLAWADVIRLEPALRGRVSCTSRRSASSDTSRCAAPVWGSGSSWPHSRSSSRSAAS